MGYTDYRDIIDDNNQKYFKKYFMDKIYEAGLPRYVNFVYFKFDPRAMLTDEQNWVKACCLGSMFRNHQCVVLTEYITPTPRDDDQYDVQEKLKQRIAASPFLHVEVDDDIDEDLNFVIYNNEVGVIVCNMLKDLILLKKVREATKMVLNSKIQQKINCPVYVTYQNEFECKVTGIFRSEDGARKAIKTNGYKDQVDVFDLKGLSAADYDYQINDDCKHYTEKLETIRRLISCLYELEGCCSGGIAHVVVDDDNFDDHSLQFVIDECNKEENKNREEVGLAKLICEELLKLDISQRALLFSGYSSFACNGDCEKCSINYGSIE